MPMGSVSTKSFVGNDAVLTKGMLQLIGTDVAKQPWSVAVFFDNRESAVVVTGVNQFLEFVPETFHVVLQLHTNRFDVAVSLGRTVSGGRLEEQTCRRLTTSLI